MREGLDVESVVEFLYAAKPSSWTTVQRSHMWNACGFVIGSIKKVSAPSQLTDSGTQTGRLSGPKGNTSEVRGGEHVKRVLQEMDDGQTDDRSEGEARQLRAREAREPAHVRKEGRRDGRRDKGRSKSRRG